MATSVLITGGAGFLGPHLAQGALARGWRVLAIDNFSTGRREHVAPLLAGPGFALLEGDVTDTGFLRAAVARCRPEIVYHLAALHFIPYCAAHPAETLRVNVLGTQSLIDALEGAAVRCFVLASTGDVYAVSGAPHREGDPLGSTNIYGRSKAFAEQLLELARVLRPRCRFLAARLFNLIGPGETNPHVLPDILAAFGRGGPVRLGNLDARRDYVFVPDAVDALLRMAEYAGGAPVFNVGTGISRSVRDLLEGLERVTGARIAVQADPARMRPSDRPVLAADASLARRELGWRPRFSLEEALRLTLEREALLPV
jgi:UDP-glucose 4-epimerase